MQSIRVQRFALLSASAGMAIVIAAMPLPRGLTADDGNDQDCADCGRKLEFELTGDKKLDAANWKAVLQQIADQHAELAAALDKAHAAKMQVWQGSSVTPGGNVDEADLPLHQWVCDNFGDPPAPGDRKDHYADVSNQLDIKIVGWLGMTRNVTANGRGWQVQIQIGPNLMSSSATTYTAPDFLETWSIGADGTLKYVSGKSLGLGFRMIHRD
jgi:hypothetical protein